MIEIQMDFFSTSQHCFVWLDIHFFALVHVKKLILVLVQNQDTSVNGKYINTLLDYIQSVTCILGVVNQAPKL